jgi:carboxyl-terminal processing protease
MKPVSAVAGAAALVAVLCAGLWLGGHPGDLPEPVRDVFVADSVGLTSEAAEVIEDNYYRDVDDRRLGEASVDGMVRSLQRRYRDRFSHYFGPDDLARFEEAISGKFSGIGLSVSEVPRGLRVGRVFARSPAQAAGIAVGDLIVSVEGESIAGEDSEVATAKIKGEAGTKVRIGVLRAKRGVRSLTLTRAEIEVPIATGRVIDVAGRKIGYVQFVSFTEGAHAALRSALEKVERQGAEGIVLDLRGNGGGLLQEAVLTASLFMPEGRVVVSTESRVQGDRTYESVGGRLPERPIVVLINRDTASAAEILAAALGEQADATLVGTRSFGKGVFQQVIDLSNGGALDLTIGEYFTPEGENLAGKGVHPDVRALDDPATAVDEARRRAAAVLARMLAQDGAPAGG